MNQTEMKSINKIPKRIVIAEFGEIVNIMRTNGKMEKWVIFGDAIQIEPDSSFYVEVRNLKLSLRKMIPIELLREWNESVD